MVRCGHPWPHNWPTQENLFGPLTDRLVSVHTRALLIGEQIILRFENGYGANILTNRLKKGLSELAVVKFFGPGIDQFDFVQDGPAPDLAWCYSLDEIFRLCDRISQLSGTVEQEAEENGPDGVLHSPWSIK
jgi:hypothetical protein